MPGMFLFGGVVLMVLALYSWEHAADEPRFSGGFGSGMTPTGRRFGAACVFFIGVGSIVAAFVG